MSKLFGLIIILSGLLPAWAQADAVALPTDALLAAFMGFAGAVAGWIGYMDHRRREAETKIFQWLESVEKEIAGLKVDLAAFPGKMSDQFVRQDFCKETRGRHENR